MSKMGLLLITVTALAVIVAAYASRSALQAEAASRVALAPQKALETLQGENKILRANLLAQSDRLRQLETLLVTERSDGMNLALHVSERLQACQDQLQRTP